MPNDPLDLWPETIRVDPLPPISILRRQAELLRSRTSGLLFAEVRSAQEEVDIDWFPSGVRVTHAFEVVAPDWNNYRHQLFDCYHDQRLVYPVTVATGDGHDDETEAATQEELIEVLRGVLNSKHGIGVIESLLVRIAEVRREKELVAPPAS